MSNYIPDITERFPEGFGGVDMTPSYYGEPVDWSRAYGYEEDDDEIPYEEERDEDKQFRVGTYFIDYEFDGGMTLYEIAHITKARDKVFVTEKWRNVDGCGKRKPHWCKVIKDDEGFEKFQINPMYDSWLSCKYFIEEV